MTFRIKASEPLRVLDAARLDFIAELCDAHGRVLRRIDPVRDAALGSTVDYGPLFAYCFHRFGTPHWDGSCGGRIRYVLSTPLADMRLVIQPGIDAPACRIFSFVAPQDVVAAAKAFKSEALTAVRASAQAGWLRPKHVGQWSLEDPLRSFALAAKVTLAALRQPVRLETGGAIDIFGDIRNAA